MGLFLTRRVRRGGPVGPQVPSRFYNDVDEVLSYLDVYNGHIERNGNRWTIVVDESTWDTSWDSHLLADSLSHEFRPADTNTRLSQDYEWDDPTWIDTTDLTDSHGFMVRPPGGTAKRYVSWSTIVRRIADSLADTGGPWGDTHPWSDTGPYWVTGGDTTTCHRENAHITGAEVAHSATPAFVCNGGINAFDVKLNSTDGAWGTYGALNADGGIVAAGGAYIFSTTSGPPSTVRAVNLADTVYAVNARVGGVNINDGSAYHFGGETGLTHDKNIVLWDTAGDSVVLQIKGGIVV
jgi:hypothetical protein